MKLAEQTGAPMAVRSSQTLARMHTHRPSSYRLFAVEHVEAWTLTESDLPALQDFFVANPDYFVAVNGMPPRADEAQQEFEDRPPPEMSFDEVYVVGFFDGAGGLVAMASVISNLLAKEVWHVGLFIVASSLHGSGAAASLYAGLEAWMQDQGACWVRLGAVAGNTRAERFWERRGYIEVRRRAGIQLGTLIQTVRVFVKPVSTSGLEEYLSLVARDRPESLLP
jgi:GNAT superfamily N-acetyltransferase